MDYLWHDMKTSKIWIIWAKNVFMHLPYEYKKYINPVIIMRCKNAKMYASAKITWYYTWHKGENIFPKSFVYFKANKKHSLSCTVFLSFISSGTSVLYIDMCRWVFTGWVSFAINKLYKYSTIHGKCPRWNTEHLPKCI